MLKDHTTSEIFWNQSNNSFIMSTTVIETEFFSQNFVKYELIYKI